jgi:hypothetical protein
MTPEQLRIEALVTEMAALRADAARLNALEKMIGNVYEGIDAVTVSLDDATGSYTLSIGRAFSGYGNTLRAAIDKATLEAR